MAENGVVQKKKTTNQLLTGVTGTLRRLSKVDTRMKADI